MRSHGIVGYDFGCPVLGVRGNRETGLRIEGEIRGTAFPVGGPYMLTAGHVIEGFGGDPDFTPVIVLYGPDHRFSPAVIVATEVIGSDVGILRLEFIKDGSDSWLKPLRWGAEPLWGFEEVRSVGYPFGFRITPDERAIVVRGFEGHIVAWNRNFKPAGYAGGSFPVYELSFAAPRGMSGALIYNAEGEPRVQGVVIGNSETSMLVLSSEERVTTPSATTIVEQYDRLRLGIAVQGPHLRTLSSRLLGLTIGEHLARYSLA
jgi:hypothetical protein